jgi:hypothetical protein
MQPYEIKYLPLFEEESIMEVRRILYSKRNIKL